MESVKEESCWKRLVSVLFASSSCCRGGEGRRGLFPCRLNLMG